MSLKPRSSCADTEPHHDSGSRAISGFVTGGLAQAKRERAARIINISFFIVIISSDTPTNV